MFYSLNSNEQSVCRLLISFVYFMQVALVQKHYADSTADISMPPNSSWWNSFPHTGILSLMEKTPDRIDFNTPNTTNHSRHDETRLLSSYQETKERLLPDWSNSHLMGKTGVWSSYTGESRIVQLFHHDSLSQIVDHQNDYPVDQSSCM